ncbi:MAG TPA: type I DNA topoisomerase [Edaphocola sp.]|nr:type I DNA topoisomerase [Edaphocola sp.]
MAKNLLIVESPAKAKTIEKILGKDFEVKSSFGHIRDLEKEGMGIDVDHNFAPKYAVSEDKVKVVRELKSLAKKANEVWLATDEDREGEAISWHLCEELGLDPKLTKRIVFHEITKPAIIKAVENPRTINMDLVHAQQARRILDRLVGFEVSPVLWRKLSGKGLSAGRVQSVAVKLIVEREREINHFTSESNFKIEALFEAKDINNKTVTFKAEGSRIKSNQEAKQFLEKCLSADYTVKNVEVKPGRKTPSAPFTTSTLQQEASRKLGYSVSKTMRVAQGLYENGYISYMRTDSVNLSETALNNAAEAIKHDYGANYHKRRQYQTKNQSAQEAHEAIRPTDMMLHNIEYAEGKSLYNLIWKRTIASQMADAVTEKTIASIAISTQPDSQLTANGEVIKFDGFLKVYLEGNDNEDDENQEGMLPPLNKGQQLPLIQMQAIERFTRPSARYTEASLVKKLEELGIGRPSTYAPTISTIQQRNYVEKTSKDGTQRIYQVFTLKNDEVNATQEKEIVGTEKNKLFPTDLGLVVTDFLSEHFSNIMDYSFTANIESEFDAIALGKKEWNQMIASFYKPFHTQVNTTMETAERAVGERHLGIDPQTGKNIIARLGRFGPMIQIGNTDDEEKPKFASLNKNQSIETISLEEALDLFKLPMTLGVFESQEVSIGIGRFGPYVKWGERFISIPKNIDPLTVNMDEAIEIIHKKQEEDAPIGTFKGEPITKGKGRFGPFIKYKDLFINVPKAYNFDNLSKGDIEELVQKKIEKEANRYIQQWTEEKIAIENGRWGPFIRFGKDMLKLGKKKDGSKYEPEDLSNISLDEVIKMIKVIDPKAFDKKTKKASTKKTAAKKTATKKTATKKTIAKKK